MDGNVEVMDVHSREEVMDEQFAGSNGPGSPSSVTARELPQARAGLGAPLLRRASSLSHSMRALPEASVQLAQQKFRKGVEVANAAQARAAELQAHAQLALAEERQISAAKLYFLTAATMLLVVVGLYFLAVAALKFLARVEVIWFFTHSAKRDDFRQWSMKVCMEPWQRESVLCQAVEGNWLARELVRAKFQQAGTHHCDPTLVPGGCAHTPCRSKGLSSKLMELKDAWSSPLNNRLNPLYYVLLRMCPGQPSSLCLRLAGPWLLTWLLAGCLLACCLLAACLLTATG